MRSGQMKREYDFSAAERGRFYRENAGLRVPASEEKPDWVGPSGVIGRFIVEEATKTLGAYREQPRLISEQGQRRIRYGPTADLRTGNCSSSSRTAPMHCSNRRTERASSSA